MSKDEKNNYMYLREYCFNVLGLSQRKTDEYISNHSNTFVRKANSILEWEEDYKKKNFYSLYKEDLVFNYEYKQKLEKWAFIIGIAHEISILFIVIWIIIFIITRTTDAKWILNEVLCTSIVLYFFTTLSTKIILYNRIAKKTLKACQKYPYAFILFCKLRQIDHYRNPYYEIYSLQNAASLFFLDECDTIIEFGYTDKEKLELYDIYFRSIYNALSSFKLSYPDRTFTFTYSCLNYLYDTNKYENLLFKDEEKSPLKRRHKIYKSPTGLPDFVISRINTEQGFNLIMDILYFNIYGELKATSEQKKIKLKSDLTLLALHFNNLKFFLKPNIISLHQKLKFATFSCIGYTILFGSILYIPAKLRFQYVHNTLYWKVWDQRLNTRIAELKKYKQLEKEYFQYVREKQNDNSIEYMTVHIKGSMNMGLNPHVGHEWGYELKVDGDLIPNDGLTFTYHIGDNITFFASATEHDKWPDYGYNEFSCTFTRQELLQGQIINMPFTVVENRGRYAGARADWEGIFSVNGEVQIDKKKPTKPIDHTKDTIVIDRDEVWQNFFNPKV